MSTLAVVLLVLTLGSLVLTLYHAVVGATKFPYLWIPLFLLGVVVLAVVYGGVR